MGRKKKPDDVEKNSSSMISLNPKVQDVEEAEELVIKITKDRVSVPDCIYFADEEMGILEVLHQRLGLAMLKLPGAAVQG